MYTNKVNEAMYFTITELVNYSDPVGGLLV